MNDKDESDSREMTLFLLREIHRLRSGELAMLRIFVEIAPVLSPEIRTALNKYARYQAEASEATLLQLEATQPALAALLDANRPLQGPDDKFDSSSQSDDSTE